MHKINKIEPMLKLKKKKRKKEKIFWMQFFSSALNVELTPANIYYSRYQTLRISF